MSPSIQFSFAALVAFEAILFGVFGVLYSVYTQYMSGLVKEDARRPPIINTLIVLCRWMKRLIWATAFLAVGGIAVSFWWPRVAEWLLAVGLLGLLVALGVVASCLMKKMGVPVQRNIEEGRG